MNVLGTEEQVEVLAIEVLAMPLSKLLNDCVNTCPNARRTQLNNHRSSSIFGDASGAMFLNVAGYK
jgi:hypothetical protein